MVRPGKQFGIGQEGCGRFQGAAIEFRWHPGHEAHAVDGAGNVNCGGNRRGLAVVDGLQFREHGSVGFHEVGEAVQQSFPQCRFHGAPAMVFECLAGRGHGSVDIGGIRVLYRQGLAAGGRVPVAIDVIVVSCLQEFPGGGVDGVQIIHCYGHYGFLRWLFAETCCLAGSCASV